MNQSFRFGKKERIFLQKEIDLVFREGKSFSAYPLRVVYVEERPSLGTSASVLISVPKKKIKHAVKRNRLKRLIREAYRLNKHSLIESLETANKGLLIAFLFTGNDLFDYNQIETAMKKALQILIKKQE